MRFFGLVLAALAASIVSGPFFRTSPAAKSAPADVRCATAPSACGFPDETNTGVPKGTKLLQVPTQVSSGPGWYYDPRGWVEVDSDGAVLSGLDIPCTVDVSASDVTIEADEIGTGGPSTIGISLRHTANVTIEDSTISGLSAGTGRMMTGIKDLYADSTGLTVLRDNISLAETGVQLESGLVQDNYIHAAGYVAGDHVNGVTSNGGGSGLLTIQHNTILIDRGQTDAIGLFEDFGVQQNRVITDNLLAGGGYAIYGGQNPGDPTTSNIVITDNQFSTIYFADSGLYGYITHFNFSGTGDTWSGNAWAGPTADTAATPITGP